MNHSERTHAFLASSHALLVSSLTEIDRLNSAVKGLEGDTESLIRNNNQIIDCLKDDLISVRSDLRVEMENSDGLADELRNAHSALSAQDDAPLNAATSAVLQRFTIRQFEVEGLCNPRGILARCIMENLYFNKKLIAGIKLHRAMTGLGLKESKELIDVAQDALASEKAEIAAEQEG